MIDPGQVLSTSRSGAAREADGSLDLPFLLPLTLVAAVWELVLLRLFLPAAEGLYPELEATATVLLHLGRFSQSLAAVLGLFLLGASTVALLRDSAFGPLAHRITVCCFATVVVSVGTVGLVVDVGQDTTLLAHAATVLFSLLCVSALAWQGGSRRVLAGVLLLLVPTLARFYSSCAIGIPLMRTETTIPLHVYRGAEVVAVLAAIAAPWLVARLVPRDFVRRPPLVAVGVAALPSAAFAATLLGSPDSVASVCWASNGFELVLPAQSVVYPIALFCFLLAAAALAMPGGGRARGIADRRLGYGMALLFVAGLDRLSGAVLMLGTAQSDTPNLLRFLLEGNWGHLTAPQQALVGPPLRDLYQLVLVALGYVLLVRGAAGHASRAESASAQRNDAT